MQGGDFERGDGRGGYSIYNKGEFADEAGGLALTFERAGQLAMANAGKNTNGSQFFITLARTQWLNGAHVIFGEVLSGMDVVRTMGGTLTDPNTNRPYTPIKIAASGVLPAAGSPLATAA